MGNLGPSHGAHDDALRLRSCSNPGGLSYWGFHYEPPFSALLLLPFNPWLCPEVSKDAGMGTIIANMIPYSLSFAISWIVLIAIWVIFNIPLGPGGPILLSH